MRVVRPVRRRQHVLLVGPEVRQPVLLDEPVGDVDPEAVGAAVEPEPQDVQELLADLRVAPVEVRLLGVEQVQVPLARRIRPAPSRASHAGPPNTARQSFGGSEPSSPRPGRKTYRARSGEPGPAASAATNHGCSSEVWFGTMSSSTRRPSRCASSISATRLVERAERRVDVAVVGDVVAAVRLG